MAFFPKDSAIQVPPNSALEKSIAAATSVAEIQQLLWQAARDQKLIEPDPLDVDGHDHFSFRPVEAGSAAAATKVARSVTLNGVKHILEAPASEGEAGLDRAEAALFRQLFANNSSTTEQQRDSQGRFVAQGPADEAEAAHAAAAAIDPAAQAEAEIVRKVLESQGVDLNALREFSQAKQVERFTQSWTEAATAFGASHPDWVGGQENKEILARLLSENHLEDAKDKSAALEAVYQHALEHNLLVEPQEEVTARRVNEATTYEELKNIVGYKDPSSSGFWGR